MSVSRRLWGLARANLTDFASALFDDDDVRLTADERARMQEELAQSVGTRAGRAARKVRDAAEEAWERAFEAAQARQGGRAPHGEVDLARWYKTLEVEPGADLETVRKAYRRLMHRYHPDRYAGDPAKYEAATQVATRITAAYNGLRRVLEG